MEAIVAYGHQILEDAQLSPPVLASCSAALAKRGRLFSREPLCSRLSLGWIHALDPGHDQRYYPAIVAADCMVAAYDLLDIVYDQEDIARTRGQLLPAGITLLNLAQELMRHANAPADRRLAAAAALAHGGRRAFGGHVRDYQQRGGTPAEAPILLSILYQRSGSLVAATCSAAALVAGGTWRQVGMAAQFGRVFAMAAQLEDDYGDQQIDVQAGRQTVPTFLALSNTAAVVHGTTWVLIRRYLRIAAHILERLDAQGIPGNTAELRRLLPPALQASSQTNDPGAAALP